MKSIMNIELSDLKSCNFNQNQDLIMILTWLQSTKLKRLQLYIKNKKGMSTSTILHMQLQRIKFKKHVIMYSRRRSIK